jgi:hypothetical protein
VKTARLPDRADRGDGHCGGDRGGLDRILGRSGAAQIWRHRTGAARRRIVATAFAALAVAGHPVPTEVIGDALADAYNALHDEELSLFPDAHETLDRFKDNAMRRRKLQLQQYSGRRGDAHDWFPRPMAGTPSNAVILRSACSGFANRRLRN